MSSAFVTDLTPPQIQGCIIGLILLPQNPNPIYEIVYSAKFFPALTSQNQMWWSRKGNLEQKQVAELHNFLSLRKIWLAVSLNVSTCVFRPVMKKNLLEKRFHLFLKIQKLLLCCKELHFQQLSKLASFISSKLGISEVTNYAALNSQWRQVTLEVPIKVLFVKCSWKKGLTKDTMFLSDAKHLDSCCVVRFLSTQHPTVSITTNHCMETLE